ncbi:uncharacterized protein LOC136039511 [Artemia franciscana]|uniref:Chitin-binding type-2 domain-containing protein n=1 Tax=Artemia franciscana TaxID=6661 RepID=A0AA88L9F2_ARTSF|nr:hypothetical protein QYM36_007391 [Artemia franciscana]
MILLLIAGSFCISVSANTEIKCTSAGYFPHPTDCTKFYRCVDWFGNGRRISTFHFDCPYGTIYDPNLFICNHAEWINPPPSCAGGQLIVPGPINIIPDLDYDVEQEKDSSDSLAEINQEDSDAKKDEFPFPEKDNESNSENGEVATVDISQEVASNQETEITNATKNESEGSQSPSGTLSENSENQQKQPEEGFNEVVVPGYSEEILGENSNASSSVGDTETTNLSSNSSTNTQEGAMEKEEDVVGVNEDKDEDSQSQSGTATVDSDGQQKQPDEEFNEVATPEESEETVAENSSNTSSGTSFVMGNQTIDTEKATERPSGATSENSDNQEETSKEEFNEIVATIVFPGESEETLIENRNDTDFAMSSPPTTEKNQLTSPTTIISGTSTGTPTNLQLSTESSRPTNSSAVALGPGDYQTIFQLNCGSKQFLRLPTACDRFYKCYWITTESRLGIDLFQCDRGLLFDDVRKRCDKPENVDCPLKASSTYTVAPGSLYDCPEPGHFPFESDCIRFYRCIEIKPKELKGLLYRCPENYGFSEFTRRCEKQETLSPCNRPTGKSVKPLYQVSLEDTTIVQEKDLDRFFKTLGIFVP